MRTFILLFILSIIAQSGSIYAQPQISPRWVRTIPGHQLYGLLDGFAKTVKRDNSGNMVVGGSQNPETGQDVIYIAKYKQDGGTLWVQEFNFGDYVGDDHTNTAFGDLVIDASGNIYFFAWAELTDSVKSYWITVKLNSSGAVQWIRQLYTKGPEESLANRSYVWMKLDADNNIVETSTEGVDETTAGIIILKYSSDGTQQFVQRFAPSGLITYARGIAVDTSRNIYIIGKRDITQNPIILLKYSGGGVFQWEQDFANQGAATGVAVDGQNNIWVSGYGSNGDTAYALKYNPAGGLLWESAYDSGGYGFNTYATVAVDGNNNAYFTGQTGVTGFPGYAMHTEKFNSAGVRQWKSIYQGPNIDHLLEQPYYLVLDAFANVYVSGRGYTSNATGYDIVTVKYDGTNGNELWHARYNGPGNTGDASGGVGLDNVGGVYAIGATYVDDGNVKMTTIKYLDPLFYIERDVTGTGTVDVDAPVAVPKNRHTAGIQSYGRLATLQFTSVSGPGNVHLQFFDTGISDSSFDGPTPSRVSNYSWTFSDSGLSPYLVQVRFDYTQVMDSTITDSSTVTIYERTTPGKGLFEPLATTKVGTEFRATVSVLGEFIFGIETAASTAQINYDASAGWNIVSIPFVLPDVHKGVLFPSAISNAYGYSLSYVTVDSLQTGSGYWLKFSHPDTLHYTGTSLTGLTINVAQGWNLIGGISTPVALAGISTNPPGIISSRLYSYNHGYISGDTLNPAIGAWIKVNQSGTLSLGGTAAPKTGPSKNPFAALNTITVEDQDHNSQTLYYGNEANGIMSSYIELPPSPPAGVFDVRYDANRIAVFSGKDKKRNVEIMVSGARYPLTIRWNALARQSSASLSAGGTVQPLNGKGEWTIMKAGKIELQLSKGGDLPAQFALEQNYPNPFNPSTSIRVDLPSESNVELKVYNILGEEVAALLNGVKAAGRYQIEWNAAAMPSGLYIYRLEASDITDPLTHISQTRKMLLLK